MASLRSRKGHFHAVFRYGGKLYERSLNTEKDSLARQALGRVEGALHCLRIGQLKIPPNVDPGDFIVSGGTLQTVEPDRPEGPSVAVAKAAYLQGQKNLIADSYLDSQRTHLGHFCQFLGNADSLPCDQVTKQHLERFVQMRLGIRDPNTVVRERNTLIRFFDWAKSQGHIEESPAAGLEPIKAGADLPPFRTIAEIQASIERGGLTDDETLDLWECLYLSPQDIAELLETVRTNAGFGVAYLLHAIPAYTGMRRGEVLRLKWTDVDVDVEEGFVTARSRKQSRTKRETARRIDLHSELRRILTAWRAEQVRGQYIVCEEVTMEPVAKDKANRLFWQPMRNTKWCLESKKNWFKIGFHTYRHSFASNLAAAGVDQRVIDEFMGHTTEAMRRRYRHLFPRDRRAAIEKLSFVRSEA